MYGRVFLWHTVRVKTVSRFFNSLPVSQGLLLVLKALPVAIFVLILRWILHYGFGVNGLMSFSDAAAVLTGATVIVGLMLAGVMADYKESEKLPSVIGGSLLSINSLAHGALATKGVDTAFIRPRLAQVAETINEWLYDRVGDDQVPMAQGMVNELIIDVEKAGGTTHYLTRLLIQASDLGVALQRVMVIRNTMFIKAGYALMTILVSIVLILFVLVDFPSEFAQWLVIGALSLAYTYLLLLVRDLDNPFGYGQHDGRGSGADVDITQFTKAYQELTA